MRKVLFSATVLKGHILKFHIPYLKWFKENGFEVWVIAGNDTSSDVNIPYCDKYIDLPFERNPFKFNNIKTYFKLKEIIDNNNFDIIHCHTPVGGVLTRIAAIGARNKKTKLIYTAHGFHFYKGASFINWMIFYPIEKFLSKYTDVLITINKEDYNLALKKFKAKSTYLVNGVGVDFSLRDDKQLKFKKDDKDFILVSVGELNKNKNHKIIMDLFKDSKLKDELNIKYYIVGEGKLYDYYLKYIKDNKLEDRVFLLGFRKDIFNILSNSDLFVFPSLREGLPVSIMEAMYCKLPCVVSNIRGNVDLIENNINGYVCNNISEEYESAILKLYNDKLLREEMADNNYNKCQKYLIYSVLGEYILIYTKLVYNC